MSLSGDTVTTAESGDTAGLRPDSTLEYSPSMDTNRKEFSVSNTNVEKAGSVASDITGEKIDSPISPDVFRLSSTNLMSSLSGDISLSEDGLEASKKKGSHCGVFGSVAFDTGKHEWYVKCEPPRASWATHYWMFIGVHSDPASFQTLAGPDAKKTGPLWGISVFNYNISGNSWISNGANTCRRHAGIKSEN